MCYSFHSGEAERIRLCKGRVFALHNEPQVARVWLPKVNSPGLAMARAFGDFCLKDFGVISVPEVSYHRLTEKDEFIVLATDGVRPSFPRHPSTLYLLKLDQKYHFRINFFPLLLRILLNRFGMFCLTKKL